MGVVWEGQWLCSLARSGLVSFVSESLVEIMTRLQIDEVECPSLEGPSSTSGFLANPFPWRGSTGRVIDNGIVTSAY